jgi:hypothetical protein
MIHPLFTFGVLALILLSQAQAASQLLADPGFEKQGWTIEGADSGMSTFTAEAAKNGSMGLRVKDDSTTAGSSAYSEMIPCIAGKTYKLEGFARMKGQGLGVYLQFYGADKKCLNGPANQGYKYDNIMAALLDSVGEWQPFSISGKAPDDAMFVRIWIHSFSGNAGILCDVDDLSLVEE